MEYLAALLPVVLYIYVVYKLDSFSLVSVRGLLLLVSSGFLAALICFELFTLTGQVVPELISDYLNPVIEEIIKAIPLLLLATRKKMVFFIDSVIFGASVGGGFAFLENIFYLTLGDGMGFGTVMFRGVETALIHLGCSAILSVALMFAVRMRERNKLGLEISGGDNVMAALLLVLPFALHILHNHIHLDPALQFFGVFGVMAVLILWIYQFDGEMIHRWLDTGIDAQVSLLCLIKKGELGNTTAGNFLQSVKDNFAPEVYFDMICYVMLFIELSVAAKCRFMLRETGLDVPIEEEKKEQYLSQYQEFETLGKSIGRTARMTLSPIVRFSPADKKSLDDLLKECRK